MALKPGAQQMSMLIPNVEELVHADPGIKSGSERRLALLASARFARRARKCRKAAFRNWPYNIAIVPRTRLSPFRLRRWRDKPGDCLGSDVVGGAEVIRWPLTPNARIPRHTPLAAKIPHPGGEDAEISGEEEEQNHSRVFSRVEEEEKTRKD